MRQAVESPACNRRRWWLLAVVGILLAGMPVAAPAQSSDDEASSEGSETPQSSPTDDGGGDNSQEEGAGPEDVDSPNADGSGPGINIDVDVGAKRVLIPMAVPDTLASGDGGEEVAETVQETLRRGLKLSGYFKVLPPNSYFFDASEEGMGASGIKFKNWFNVGAQGLVKSSVETDGDQVRLDLRLFNVDTGQRVTLDWSRGTVGKDEVRGRVHDFINVVLEHYTGTKGVFGSRISYVKRNDRGQKEVYVAQMDGSNRTKITDNNSINMLPSWGDDAVYFTSYVHQNPDLWRWKNGTTTKVSSRDGQNSGAAYCGGTLAVTLSMGGENADIYLLEARSGDMKKRLTDNWAIDTSPTWSPDCSKIAFVSGRSGAPQIYVMNADGTDQKRLTFEGSYNTSPDWSPKGDKIVFTARDKYNKFDIFLVNLEGDLTRLTQDQGNNEEPSFSPRGRYIIFSSDRGGQGNRLWLMTADGQIQHPVTPDASGFRSPAWQK